jgi:DNA-binding CsgD family transcriptional regulator
MAEPTAAPAPLLGREAELARVASIVSGRGGARGLVLVGEPGIGKTAVWDEALAAARQAGVRVLAARASEPELQLSFVALSDLLDGADLSALEELPPPQLAALEIALLRREPGTAPPDPLAVAAGLSAVLRRLTDERPALLGIDDVAWLDRASAEALAFAVRRLRGRAIRFLFTRRSDQGSALESAFGRGDLERLEVGALSLGAVRSLLAERLALSPPRRVLLRLYDLSQGSPLVALELGRMLVHRGLPDVGEELPLPELVDELFSRRIAELDASVRRALLAVALAGGLSRLELSTLIGPLALEDAVTAGLLLNDGSRVRASHPLLAAAVRRGSSAHERRDVHLDLAATLDDETLRARHLALATDRPDPPLAERVESAAAVAIRRGAVHDAVELSEQALRLTPVGSETYEPRLFELVRYLTVAGEQPRVRELLEARLPDLRPGPARARALLLLSDTGERLSEMEAYVERALVEGGENAELRATALATKALIFAIVRFERLEDAEGWAQEALRLADSAGPETQRRALHALAWINVMRGRPLEAVAASFLASPREASLYESAIERPAGIRLMVRGHIDESRAVFDRLRALAADRGEALSASVMHRQLCEIELRAGDVTAARQHLDQWGEWTLPDDVHEQVVGPARCHALLEAIQGRSEEALRWADRAIAAAGAIENYREETEARRAAGIAWLLARDPRKAVEELLPLWQHARREAIDDPGVMPVAPDLVEALVELDELEPARAVTATLSQLAEEQDHPWGLASAKRCRAMVRVAADEDAAAERELEEAAAAYLRIGLRFDAGRSMLLLGRAQRRRRRWAAARDSLERASETFTSLGAAGWADEAHAELARVGGRRPTAPGALSNTERQVAELAAQGRSNKAIAAELHISTHTVEKHLSRAYAKLGVRSRGELAHHLRAPLT